MNKTKNEQKAGKIPAFFVHFKIYIPIFLQRKCTETIIYKKWLFICRSIIILIEIGKKQWVKLL